MNLYYYMKDNIFIFRFFEVYYGGFLEDGVGKECKNYCND